MNYSKGNTPRAASPTLMPCRQPDSQHLKSAVAVAQPCRCTAPASPQQQMSGLAAGTTAALKVREAQALPTSGRLIHTAIAQAQAHGAGVLQSSHPPTCTCQNTRSIQEAAHPAGHGDRQGNHRPALRAQPTWQSSPHPLMQRQLLMRWWCCRPQELGTRQVRERRLLRLGWERRLLRLQRRRRGRGTPWMTCCRRRAWCC